MEANFDHGSVSIACQLARKPPPFADGWGRFGHWWPRRARAKQAAPPLSPRRIDEVTIRGGAGRARTCSAFARLALAVGCAVAALDAAIAERRDHGLPAQVRSTCSCPRRARRASVASRRCPGTCRGPGPRPAGPQGRPAQPVQPARKARRARRGPAGPQGPPGRPARSLRSRQLAGIALHRPSDGGAGTVAVETATDGAIVLSCEEGGVAASACAAGRSWSTRSTTTRSAPTAAASSSCGTTAPRRADLDRPRARARRRLGRARVRPRAPHRHAGRGRAPGVAIEAQNGAPDGVALVDTAAGTLLDALSYEGAITAAQIGSATVSLVEGTVLPATRRRLEHRRRLAQPHPRRQRHERRGHRLGVHDHADARSGERRHGPDRSAGRRVLPRGARAALPSAPFARMFARPLRADLRPALPLLRLEALVEPALEVGQLALQLLVALPAPERRASRPRAPPARRSRARCDARSR